MRLAATRELAASPDEVWQLLSEPHHLSDWWPGYAAVLPDRRGVATGARWEVVRDTAPGLLRRPGGRGAIVIGVVEAGRALGWRDLEQGFSGHVRIEPSDRGARCTVVVDAPWWRIPAEGLRRVPERALSRLHALCQTAAELRDV